MHSDHSATFSGKVNGAETAAIPPVAIDNSDRLTLPAATLHSSSRSSSLSRPLSRQEPFGLTVIVGGTNVRLCLSHLHSPEPVTQAFKWQSLRDEYNATPESAHISFEDSHHVTYPELAKRCERFVRSNFERPDEPFEVDNFSSLTFSMAGVVDGDGIGARVTTSNTLLKIRNEPFAEKFTSEFQCRMPKLRLKDTKVRVINDAKAGLEGELYFNNIDRSLVTLFLILGTGMGSACTKEGFAELGHLVVLDTKIKQFRFLTKKEFAASKASDGSFKPLEGLIFAENLLAGPWTAIGFVKCLSGHEPPLLTALAEHIAAAESNDGRILSKVRSSGEVFAELKRIQKFENGERHLWAGHANESTLGAINRLIFTRKHCDLAKRAKALGSLDSIKATDPRLALDIVAERKWKVYFDVVGKVAGVVYQRMLQEGLNPHAFIAGGGIGELSNCYEPKLRQQAINLITKGGELPEGLFDFSRISPTARESASSHQNVVERARRLAH